MTSPMVLWGTPSSIQSSGHLLARLHGAAHDPCFFLDNLHTPPRSHTNYDLDLKPILLVFTSPRCDLLLHSLKRSLALKRSYCILVSYDSVFRSPLHSYKSLDVQSFPHVISYKKYLAHLSFTRPLHHS